MPFIYGVLDDIPADLSFARRRSDGRVSKTVEATDLFCQFRIIGDDHSTFATRHVFRALKAETRHVTDRADHPSLVGPEEALSVIFDYREFVFCRQRHKRVKIDG